MEKLHVTKNKIKVYSYNMPHLHSFYLSLYIRAGTIYEEPRGITHFLEHVYCKSLKDRFQNDTIRELDKYGLELNATTGHSYMSFEISGNAKFFKEASRIFVNLLDPDIATLEAYKVERERLKRETEEDYNPVAIRNIAFDAVWDGTPLSIHQNSDIIESITLSQLKAERKKIFNTANLFFYATGSISQKDLEFLYTLVDDYKLSENGTERKNILTPPAGFLARNVNIYHMPTTINFNSVAICFDYDATKYSQHEINFINRLLFYGHGAAFYTELSDKLGLIYNYENDIDNFDNIGNIAYNFDVAHEGTFQSIQTAIKLLGNAKIDMLDFDFERVKAFYTHNSHYILDNVEEMNEYMAFDNHISNYNYTDFSQLVDKYNAITKERILQIAQEIFCPDNITIAIKWQKKPDLKKIREIVKKGLSKS